MVDILCLNELLKKLLIFKKQKCAANTYIFEKVAEEMNGRATASNRKDTITHSQITHNFEILVKEYKSINLGQWTASEISRYQVHKGYRKWCVIGFPLVAIRGL